MRSSCSVCILSSVFAWGSSVSCLSASSLSLLETGSGVRPVDVCFDLWDAMRGLSRGSAYGTYWPEPNASILDIQEDMRFSWQMPHGSKE